MNEYKHYVYRHIRLDKNEPFYIGIGTQYRYSKAIKYGRARKKSGRNKIWYNIYEKTNNFIWEILFESNDYEEIKQKEIEFIKLYGRIDLGTGILANMTDGGDSILTSPKFAEAQENHKIKCYKYDLEGNFIKAYDSIINGAIDTDCGFTGIRECCLGLLKRYKQFIWRFEYKEKLDICIRSQVYTPIYQYALNGEYVACWNSSEEAGKFFNINAQNIKKSCECIKQISSSGFQWRYFKCSQISKFISKRCKSIEKLDLDGNFIKKYTSALEASEENNLSCKLISAALRGRTKTSGGFKWRFTTI